MGEQFQKLGLFGEFSTPSENTARSLLPGLETKVTRCECASKRSGPRAARTNSQSRPGRGGLMDAEFVAQVMCLENGWRAEHVARTGTWPNRPGSPGSGEVDRQLSACWRRVEGILRRWSSKGKPCCPPIPPYYRVSVRCGFASPEECPGGLESMAQADTRSLFAGVWLRAGLESRL